MFIGLFLHVSVYVFGKLFIFRVYKYMYVCIYASTYSDDLNTTYTYICKKHIRIYIYIYIIDVQNYILSLYIYIYL